MTEAQQNKSTEATWNNFKENVAAAVLATANSNNGKPTSARKKRHEQKVIIEYNAQARCPLLKKKNLT